jgi:hypothetical protein
MRNLFTLLIAVVVVAAGGYALCAAAGWNPRPAAMATAAAAALAAGAAGLVPLLLSRGAGQAAVSQAGLVGTVVHLFGCLAGAMVLLFVLKAGTPAMYWVLAFYWATLMALVLGLTRAVRAAPADGAAPRQ